MVEQQEVVKFTLLIPKKLKEELEEAAAEEGRKLSPQIVYTMRQWLQAHNERRASTWQGETRAYGNR